MIEFFGILAGVLNTIRLAPQVYKSWTTKKTEDLSGYFLLILFLQSVCLISYGLLKPDNYIIYMNISPLLCSVILAKLKLKYG
jgi:uncharacterized protein with PQ loop repeat